MTEDETDQPPPDAMVLLAALVSRPEALVSSMLGAAGIEVHAGGLYHASIEVNSLALGEPSHVGAGAPAYQSERNPARSAR